MIRTKLRKSLKQISQLRSLERAHSEIQLHEAIEADAKCQSDVDAAKTKVRGAVDAWSSYLGSSLSNPDISSALAEELISAEALSDLAHEAADASGARLATQQDSCAQAIYLDELAEKSLRRAYRADRLHMDRVRQAALEERSSFLFGGTDDSH